MSYSLDPFPPDVVVAVADLALEAGELAVLVARLALQALRLHHLIYEMFSFTCIGVNKSNTNYLA